MRPRRGDHEFEEVVVECRAVQEDGKSAEPSWVLRTADPQIELSGAIVLCRFPALHRWMILDELSDERLRSIRVALILGRPIGGGERRQTMKSQKGHLCGFPVRSGSAFPVDLRAAHLEEDSVRGIHQDLAVDSMLGVVLDLRSERRNGIAERI